VYNLDEPAGVLPSFSVFVLEEGFFENFMRFSGMYVITSLQPFVGKEFNEGKFMHLLLNQWGHLTRQETRLHFSIVGERLAVLYSGGNISLVERKLPHDTFIRWV